MKVYPQIILPFPETERYLNLVSNSNHPNIMGSLDSDGYALMHTNLKAGHLECAISLKHCLDSGSPDTQQHQTAMVDVASETLQQTNGHY